MYNAIVDDDIDEPLPASQVPVEMNFQFVDERKNCNKYNMNMNMNSSKDHPLKNKVSICQQLNTNEISTSDIIQMGYDLNILGKDDNNNNDKVINDVKNNKIGNEYMNYEVNIDDEDECMDNLASKILEKNRTSTILTTTKDHYFNDKIIKFNKSKQQQNSISTSCINNNGLYKENNHPYSVTNKQVKPLKNHQLSNYIKAILNSNNTLSDILDDDEEKVEFVDNKELLLFWKSRYVSSSATKHVDFRKTSHNIKENMEKTSENTLKFQYNSSNIPTLALLPDQKIIQKRENKLDSINDNLWYNHELIGKKPLSIHTSLSGSFLSVNPHEEQNKNLYEFLNEKEEKSNENNTSLHNNKTHIHIANTTKLSSLACKEDNNNTNNKAVLKQKLEGSNVFLNVESRINVVESRLNVSESTQILSFLSKMPKELKNPKGKDNDEDDAGRDQDKEKGEQLSKDKDNIQDMNTSIISETNMIKMPSTNSPVIRQKLLPPNAQEILNNSDSSNFSELLIKYIFACDILSIRKLLVAAATLQDKINFADQFGNTPLLLAAKLAYKHKNYHFIMKELLENGADPTKKDNDGWSALDEAVSQADMELVEILFEYLRIFKKRKIMKQEENLKKILQTTPDFYLEMKWDFESNVIPFFSKIAPSDTFKIWKYKANLRLDNTLVGLKNFKAKRRDMSLIYNNSLGKDSKSIAMLSINRTKSQYTNIMQELDDEEKNLLLLDIIRAEPLQGMLNIQDCQLEESKNWLGQKIYQKISEWETKKYNLKLIVDYTLFKRGKTLFDLNYSEYTKKLNHIKSIKSTEATIQTKKSIEEVHNNKESIVEMNTEDQTRKNLNDIFSKKAMNFKINTKEDTNKNIKKFEANIWLAKNFPLKFESILSTMSFLSHGNSNLNHLNQIMQTEEIKKLLNENAFPIKLQIPINYSIKANVTFTKFEQKINKSLLNSKQNYEHLFMIPKGCKYLDRKSAQKIVLRPKKRIILLNMVI